VFQPACTVRLKADTTYDPLKEPVKKCLSAEIAEIAETETGQ
jgi:hypothetical protein